MPTRTDSPLTFRALSPADPDSWQWWPAIVGRMLTCLPRLDPTLPVETIIRFVATQAEQAPLSVRWWVALNEHAHVVGHAVGWVDTAWGVPYLLIHHAVMDEGYRAPVSDWIQDVAAWGEALNQVYAAMHSPYRIQEARFWSSRGDEAWDRKLDGLVTKTAWVKHLPLEALRCA